MTDLVRDMVQNDPTQRPTIDQVVVRFETIQKKLSTIRLRSRISPRGESIVMSFFRTLPHISRSIKYTLQRHPAVPTR
jgi:hypothetical protein